MACLSVKHGAAACKRSSFVAIRSRVAALPHGAAQRLTTDADPSRSIVR